MYKIFNVGLIILLGITMCACKDTKSNRVDEALAKKQKEEEKLNVSTHLITPRKFQVL